MEVTLREYRPGDLDAMYRLDVECFEPVFRFSRRAMRRFAEAESAVTVLAEAAGELAGFGIAEAADDAAYVVTVDVAGVWRRKGVGRLVMKELETKAKTLGAEWMWLHVFAGNAHAIRLYESMSYECMGVERGFYKVGLDALMYRKQM